MGRTISNFKEAQRVAILTPEQHGPHDARPMLEMLFHQRAMQYYASARFAARAGLMPIAGNLFHHAIEMILKSHLSRTVSTVELKDKFGHDLKKLWQKFKDSFPNEADLSKYDGVVADLDRFDDIRYPEEVVKAGMITTISWHDLPVGLKVGNNRAQPYVLLVPVLDRLIARIAQLFLGAEALLSNLHHDQTGLDMVRYKNPESMFWFHAPPLE
jgi:HEPN domain-containing protein